MKVVCVGDNCIDYYVKEKLPFFGGNPVNDAIYAKRLGHEASYIGAMGTDELGKQFLEALKKKDIDVSYVKVLEGTTPVTEVFIKDNDRILGDYDEGVFEQFKLNADDLAYINTFDVMFTGIWSRVENDLKDINIPIAVDFADKLESKIWDLALPYISFAFYSDDGHDEDEIKAYLKRRYQNNLKAIICTRGDKGSICYDGKDFYSYGIIACDVKDTMGAGDSYITAFVLSYLKDQDVLKAMQSGAGNASITLGYSGAW